MLEVIATSLNDIEKINQSKATQIELCAAGSMNEGGYTPDYQLISEACKISKIPVKVMVRRSNNGFNINDEEFLQLQKDIIFIKKTKAAGVVCGILTADNLIDIEKMRIIIKLSYPLKLTFHRAFDVIKNKKSALETLSMLKIDTVLTSGGNDNIIANIKTLKNLANLNTPVNLLIGSGINQKNYYLFKQNQLTNFHIGKAARVNQSFDHEIDINAIDYFFEN